MIGFIGTGNMGGAMINSIASAGESVCIYDVNVKQYEKFENDLIKKCNTVEGLLAQCKYIVLSVKPQYYKSVCKEINPHLMDKHVIVTVAPGYTLHQMKDLIDRTVKVVRTMPNTPALIGEGVTAYCYNKSDIEEQELNVLVGYLNQFGRTYEVIESQMDAVIAVSGSSPAYAYMFIEAMADAAVSFGMPRQQAYEMAAGAIKGACEMILQTGKHPGQLKDEVTSPGGTTIQAVNKLEETAFRSSVIKGMEACVKQAAKMRENI